MPLRKWHQASITVLRCSQISAVINVKTIIIVFINNISLIYFQHTRVFIIVYANFLLHCLPRHHHIVNIN